MTAANSAIAAIAAASNSTSPPSFNGDGQLYALNLFLSAAIMSLAIMRGGRVLATIWFARWRDRPMHPVTLWRAMLLCICAAVALRTGAEAGYLLGWSPNDPELTARLLMAKRWIDPISAVFTMGWMAMHDLAGRTIEEQLMRRPLPVRIWARATELRRPAAVVGLCLVMAIGVVWARG